MTFQNVELTQTDQLSKDDDPTTYTVGDGTALGHGAALDACRVRVSYQRGRSHLTIDFSY